MLERAAAAGVTRVVTVASDPDDAERALAIAQRAEGVWATVGLHPHAAAGDSADARRRIADLARETRVVAVGETGLDYYYDNAPRAAQRAALAWHVELAADLNRPLVVHAREADDDAAAMLREAAGRVRGVLHCFASGVRLLDAGLEADWYVSFAGLVSFRNYESADLLRAVPPERLLIETDSPYLAPVPMRGQRNEPAFVAHVAGAVARLRDEDVETVAAQTTANALRFYGIPED